MAGKEASDGTPHQKIRCCRVMTPSVTGLFLTTAAPDPLIFAVRRKRILRFYCRFKVISVNADTICVRIVPDAVSFSLLVSADDGDERDHSMASAPDEKGFIGLHIGASEINTFTRKQSWPHVFLKDASNP